jgi:plastocyanin
VSVLLVLAAACGFAQEYTLRGKVEVVHRSKQRSGSDNVVLWLMPEDPSATTLQTPKAVMLQRDKRFSPHVVVVRTGTEIEFPNQDPFFHDVFSIYQGRPFDLGLYESGTTRKVRFSRTGVSYIFCNIHPEMSAAVVAVPTPYFAVTLKDGSFEIGHLMPGRYKMRFWYELASPAELDSIAREVSVDQISVPVVVTVHSSDIPTLHLNKYGQEYPAEKSHTY